MENNMPGYGPGYGGQDLLWLWALFGDGFGHRRGHELNNGEGFGVRSHSTLQDLNAAQNALTSSITNVNRDQSDNALRNETGQMGLQASIAAANSANLIGQKDITANLNACCCDIQTGQKDIVNAVQYQGLNTVNAIEKCCCDTQNAIAMQTHQLSSTICNEGQSTRSLITDNRMQDLQIQIGICRDENSNLRQTNILSEKIQSVCGPPLPCYPVDPCNDHNGHRGTKTK